MLTTHELNRIYAEELLSTGSHDQSIKKVAWVAFQRGVEVLTKNLVSEQSSVDRLIKANKRE